MLFFRIADAKPVLRDFRDYRCSRLNLSQVFFPFFLSLSLPLPTEILFIYVPASIHFYSTYYFANFRNLVDTTTLYDFTLHRSEYFWLQNRIVVLDRSPPGERILFRYFLLCARARGELIGPLWSCRAGAWVENCPNQIFCNKNERSERILN